MKQKTTNTFYIIASLTLLAYAPSQAELTPKEIKQLDTMISPYTQISDKKVYKLIATLPIHSNDKSSSDFIKKIDDFITDIDFEEFKDCIIKTKYQQAIFLTEMLEEEDQTNSQDLNCITSEKDMEYFHKKVNVALKAYTNTPTYDHLLNDKLLTIAVKFFIFYDYIEYLSSCAGFGGGGYLPTPRPFFSWNLL